MSGVATWADVRRLLEAESASEVVMSKGSLCHPRHVGAHPSAGWPRGQLADYRFAAESEHHGLHVLELADDWLVELDRPASQRADGRGARSRPRGLMPGGALAGAVAGAAMTRSQRGALVVAALGVLTAAMLEQRSAGSPTDPNERGKSHEVRRPL